MLVDGVVKRNLGGQTEIVKICEREQERVRIVKDYFAITLTEEEKEGMKGRNVELLST
jgi:hypothetical protein